MIDRAIPLLYIGAAASFILALKWLSSVPTARRGVVVGAAGMALAVACSMINIVGGYLITYRMLRMFRKSGKNRP